MENNRTRQVVPNSLLLASLVFLVFFLPMLQGTWHRAAYSLFFSCIFLLSALSIRHQRKKQLVALAAALIAVTWIAFLAHLSTLSEAVRYVQAIAFVYIVVQLIVQTAAAQQVNLRVIADSISGYLLVGIVFAMATYSVLQYDPASYHFPDDSIPNEDGSLSAMFYYTFVTYSSTGYGDITPQHPASRALSTLISVSGQMYVAVIIALLVGKFSAGVRTEK